MRRIRPSFNQFRMSGLRIQPAFKERRADYAAYPPILQPVQDERIKDSTSL